MDIATDSVGFSELDLRPELVRALGELGYEEPTPIQRQAIPPLIGGRDLLGQAATGTGKTAAFALPILQLLPTGERKQGPTALVLVPTRELAIQVAEAVRRYGRELGVQVLPVYGGQPIFHQLKALRRGTDVVVATPGRALDHLARGSLSLDAVRITVLDEADEMLDMGFAEDLASILEAAPKERQTVLFSATLPRRILDIAETYLRDPVRITVRPDPDDPASAPKVRQVAYLVPRAHKLTALTRVLDLESPASGLIFCRTRVEVDTLAEALATRGYRAEALHGGLTQERRDRVMRRLRTGAAELLVATDVAARGLDVEGLTHVFNFDLPAGPDAYVHRIGRVGRAGREGVAITLIEPREHRVLRSMERTVRQKIEVAQLPTVADLRAARMEVTKVALRDLLVAGGLDRYRGVVEALCEEFDVMDVAAAAVRLAHDAEGEAPEDQEEVPSFAPRTERPPRPEPSGPMATLYVSLGRSAGVRPQDLVGAIAGESGLPGSAIGAIQIADRFSLVEIPASAADEVLGALKGTTIRGQRVAFRRDRRDGRKNRPSRPGEPDAEA
jgi:ATP-dependent RNA helicase DeaD